MNKWARGPLLILAGLVSILMAAGSGRAQVTGDITTIAGAAADGLTALTTNINGPNGVCVDLAGNLYLTDTANHRVRRVATNGTITTIAGDGFGDDFGFGRFAGDNGPATAASLNAPRGVTVDSLGTVYIADSGNHRIRKVTTGGLITTVAGDGYTSADGSGRFAGDSGAATSASLSGPRGLAVTSDGTIYIADTLNQRIRKVTPTGLISSIVGTGTAGFLGDGAAAVAANVNFPLAVCVDTSGTLYIADTYNHRIRKVTPAGIISTVVGSGTAGFSGDGAAATSARVNFPNSVAVDPSGNLYLTDTSNHRIRKVGVTGLISTLAGDGYLETSGLGRFAGDGGQAIAASLNGPRSVSVDTSGVVYIADTINHRIRKITRDGLIVSVAGSGNDPAAGDGGPATAANLLFPTSVFVYSPDALYIADTANHRIRKIASNGTISTVAGDGFKGADGLGRYGGDGGPATAASFSLPTAIKVDASGAIYVSDAANHRIRKISPTGTITTIAGSGVAGFTGDGAAATTARLSGPRGVFVDHDGNVFIADTSNHRIRRVTPGGIISTIAGNGKPGYSGDGGIATAARLYGPTTLYVDPLGTVYIADTYNHRIRKVTAAGIISTVAGDGFSYSNGSGRFGGDGGVATLASLNYPSDVVLDPGGSLLIADSANHRIRRVATGGVITTIVGDGFTNSDRSGRYGGDGGAATAASTNYPRGLFLDEFGDLSFSDTSNRRIRKVFGDSFPTTEISSPASLTVAEAQGAIKIEWTTTQVPTRLGFNLYRSVQPDTGFTKLNAATITGQTQSFVYIDPQAIKFDQTYYYKLETVDISGATKQFGPISLVVPLAARVELYQNAPNPFNPSTTIRYALTASSKVSLHIYNLLGQEVVTLLNNTPKQAGFDSVAWNGLNSKGQAVASGVYIFRLTTDTGFTLSKQLTLLK